MYIKQVREHMAISLTDQCSSVFEGMGTVHIWRSLLPLSFSSVHLQINFPHSEAFIYLFLKRRLSFMLLKEQRPLSAFINIPSNMYLKFSLSVVKKINRVVVHDH